MLVNGTSGLIGAILAPVEANRDGTLMSTKKPAVIRPLGNPGKRPLICRKSRLRASHSSQNISDDARGCIQVIRNPCRLAFTRHWTVFAFRDGLVIHKQPRMRSAIGLCLTVPGSTGSQVTSPWIKILNQQTQILASLGDRLGLDPRSRAALRLPSANQQRSKFEGLIGQTGLYRPLRN
jgi:hypothetical protein